MTDRPQTLLQFASAPARTATLTGAAVVVIDAQEEYRSGRLPLEGVDTAVSRVQDILAAARAADVPVVHIRQMGRPGGLFDPQTPFGDIMVECAPQRDEPVVEKKLPNSFAGTGLQELLEGLGVSHLVIVGFMTHMCVSATTRAALDLGHASLVVSDAVATRALPDQIGTGVIPAQAVHAATLAALGDRFATIVTTEQLLAQG